jgi:DNA-binding NarL/FixJ family response regulator
VPRGRPYRWLQLVGLASGGFDWKFGGIENHRFTPGPRTTLVIADDCPAMREGLARLVADECDLAVSGSAATGGELRALIARQAPQVLVLEIMLRDDDGLALIKDLRALAPGMSIVVFTAQSEETYAERCLRAGARAFLNKHAAVAALFRAVRETAAGGIVVPPAIAGRMLGADDKRLATGPVAQLSDRELQVFRLAGLGRPTRVIAKELGVSIKTVESHRENIKNKLDLDSHAELVARAAQWLRDSGG